MKKLWILAILLFAGCSENYSNGERIGLVTKFSKSGALWKSWEGQLNVTQTGMNSGTPFEFSIDNDNEPDDVIRTLQNAAEYGWKMKLTYHETFGKNWFSNRGSTDHFITKAQVLDSNAANPFHGAKEQGGAAGIHDTIYVVIRKDLAQ
jgi:hypothetical protein